MRVQWGAGLVNLGFDDASFKLNKETQDYTTFESLGLKESATCVLWVSGAVKGRWNAAANVYDAGIGIYPRDDGGPFKAFVNQTDADFWLFSAVTIPSCTMDGSLAGKLIAFSFDYESNGGPFLIPTGSFGIQNG
jgi:hypothetical protein